MTTRIPHVSIHILDLNNRELVTAIEVLSPTNKRGQGYQEYLEKRDEIFQRQTHLIEVDLLREGRRIPTQKPLPPCPALRFSQSGGEATYDEGLAGSISHALTGNSGAPSARRPRRDTGFAEGI